MLHNILHKLWFEPCLLLPSMHAQICEIVYAHMDGTAHRDGGITEQYTFSSIHDDDDKFTLNSQVTRAGEHDRIAIVPIEGIIDKKVSALQKISGAVDVEEVDAVLTGLISDTKTSGIILSFDSPGGSLTGVTELAELIKNFSLVKPIVSFTDTVVASSALWLASAAPLFITSRSATVGAIGVYLALLDRSRQMEMEGVKVDLIRAGTMKAAGFRGLPLTGEERAQLQDRVDLMRSWFVAFLLEFREIKDESMQGQVFFGEEALQRGLVDRLGDLNDAVEEIEAMIDMNFGM